MTVHKPAQAVLEDLSARDLLELAEDVRVRRGVTTAELYGRGRTQSVSRARHEIWWRMRNHPERHYSLLEIARLFGRDHATVKVGVEAHQRRLALAAPAAAPQPYGR